jgi:hypothetical protein
VISSISVDTADDEGNGNSGVEDASAPSAADDTMLLIASTKSSSVFEQGAAASPKNSLYP